MFGQKLTQEKDGATFFSIHMRFMLFLPHKLLLIPQRPAQMFLLWET